jgi:hypothetical protein
MAKAAWPRFDRVRRKQELMDRMMHRLGVDPLTAVRIDDGRAFVSARARCRDCTHESECRVWLDRPHAAPLPPDFCPNGDFFEECGLLGAHGLGRERVRQGSD